MAGKGGATLFDEFKFFKYGIKWSVKVHGMGKGLYFLLGYGG